MRKLLISHKNTFLHQIKMTETRLIVNIYKTPCSIEISVFSGTYVTSIRGVSQSFQDYYNIFNFPIHLKITGQEGKTFVLYIFYVNIKFKT